MVSPFPHCLAMDGMRATCHCGGKQIQTQSNTSEYTGYSSPDPMAAQCQAGSGNRSNVCAAFDHSHNHNHERFWGRRREEGMPLRRTTPPKKADNCRSGNTHQREKESPMQDGVQAQKGWFRIKLEFCFFLVQHNTTPTPSCACSFSCWSTHISTRPEPLSLSDMYI